MLLDKFHSKVITILLIIILSIKFITDGYLSKYNNNYYVLHLHELVQIDYDVLLLWFYNDDDIIMNYRDNEYCFD